MADNNGIRTKWDERFLAEDFALGENPSPYLKENIGLIKSLVPGNKALDLACGEGRNSIYLAANGFTVTALDISEVGLEKGRRWMERERLHVDFRIADLEQYNFTETFDLIINFNFLLRDLIPKSISALNPSGVLVFDSLLDSPFVPTTHKKEFLLQPGELQSIFSTFPGTILRPEEYLRAEQPTAKLIFKKG